MKQRSALTFFLLLLVLSLALSSCVPLPAAAPAEAVPAAPALATAKVISTLSNQPGRAFVAARGNHFVIDSVPPLAGPNEEVNPFDALLGALGTCAVFVYESAAQEQGIPMNGLKATVQGDFMPAGVKDGSVNPRVRAFRVHMDVEGPNAAQLTVLATQWKARCPIYTTLIRAADIELTHNAEAGSKPAEGLATATAVVALSHQPGRAIVSARGNHFVADSVPPLGGPNEERNPMDLFLAALATCNTFVYEKAAEELGIPLTSLTVTAEGDFYPAGLKDGSVNPRLQAFRVIAVVEGPTAEQADALAEQYQLRCPIYTTLSRSAPVTIENVVQMHTTLSRSGPVAIGNVNQWKCEPMVGGAPSGENNRRYCRALQLPMDSVAITPATKG